MSRFAQFRSATWDRPWDWILYLLFALYVALSFHVGLWGALLAFVGLGLFSRLLIAWASRRQPPSSELSQIGTIEMEFAAWTVPGNPIKLFLGAFILFLVLWLILFCYAVLTAFESHFQGHGDDPDLQMFIGQACLYAMLGMSMYTTYRIRWRRLLITDQGLFQVVDPKRPWPSERPLDEPHSPLRAKRIYGWNQLARFHWSRQSGEHVLHLNVHQPGFGVPQLVSFTLRGISEENWQKLDRLLRAHLSDRFPEEPGRALTTSATD